MVNQLQETRKWTKRRDEKNRRMSLVKSLLRGSILPTDHIVDAMEALVSPGDKVVLEGNN